MVEFGGWDMPIHYPRGIVQEHLATRKRAGLFDVSHMGRFVIRGQDALPFLQYTFTNNAAALQPGRSHYTFVPNETGGALDDAYLYYFIEGEYLLVVNAANREKVWQHIHTVSPQFPHLEIDDQTEATALLSLQGPSSEQILTEVLESGSLPESKRNSLSSGTVQGVGVAFSRTGYTGEPHCFELFVERQDAETIWKLLCEKGAEPVGLGARDTLRLEAGLPLYGHELGRDPAGEEIPVFAAPASRFGVKFVPEKGEFIGKAALFDQFGALQAFKERDFSRIDALPRRVRPIVLTEKGIARAGAKVFHGGKLVGYVTSGTMVPYWIGRGEDTEFTLSEETGRRAIGLALLDSELSRKAPLEVEVRGKHIPAKIVLRHVKAEPSGYLRAVGT